MTWSSHAGSSRFRDEPVLLLSKLNALHDQHDVSESANPNLRRAAVWRRTTCGHAVRVVAGRPMASRSRRPSAAPGRPRPAASAKTP